MDARASRYYEVYRRSLADPEGFWGEAARAIDWIEPPKKVFDAGAGVYGSGISVLLVSLLVVGIGLSLGGPTGYAINPARDLGPRIAHALLPIHKKGGSNWRYAPVPVLGPLLGAALAGVAVVSAFRQRVQQMDVPPSELARQHWSAVKHATSAGVDVWLNTPRRPMEASGTSGMKAAANGALNCSILDGWWCEGYDGTNGWAIGRGEDYTDLEYQDDVESRALYDLLEKHIVPEFYERRADNLPRGWIKRMKRTIRTLGWRFNADRMVMDYTLKCYVPAAGGTSSEMTGTG